MKGFTIGTLVGVAVMWSMGENFNERGLKTGYAVILVFFFGATGFCFQIVARARRALLDLIDDKK